MKNIIGIGRIIFGSIFLWAFFDKLFGLGYATCRDSKTMEVITKCEGAWVSGGSPTEGFLKFGTHGPLASFYQSLAGNMVVDVLFMMGLLLIGVSLVLGIGMKIATYSGALLMLLMWSSLLPPENHPIIDEHIVYIFFFLILHYLNAGDILGFGKYWKKSGLGKKHPILI